MWNAIESTTGKIIDEAARLDSIQTISYIIEEGVCAKYSEILNKKKLVSHTMRKLDILQEEISQVLNNYEESVRKMTKK